ncbi:hypothetical protein CBER1_04814 [Cercospora berteroae]|uniref:Uncharacterized protein n=1 Tax=Cercospora berteroae TaxID=357750 RepID=A0A2S6BRL6_9PEZI|nr:hypothetical protein CBER1_04814 [Cercospora berteroae]
MPSITSILALGMATIALAAPIDTLPANMAVARDDNGVAHLDYIYTQKERREEDGVAHLDYIYTQKEKREGDSPAHLDYIYTQKE